MQNFTEKKEYKHLIIMELQSKFQLKQSNFSKKFLFSVKAVILDGVWVARQTHF